MKRKAAEKLNRPINKNARLITWPVKLSSIEAMEIEKKSLEFAEGNRSLFIRSALLNYKPKKEDFT